MTTCNPIDHDVAWLALLASGVDGSANVSRDEFTDELRRLAAAKECCHEPRPATRRGEFPLEGTARSA